MPSAAPSSSPSSRARTLLVVLAGGRGGRLAPLTDGRAKPALTFGGSYRLIDIVLSNAMHSGLSDVWVVEQYEPHALNDHLASGRPWDLDRTHGGLQVLSPFQGADGEGFSEGNADALVRQRRFIAGFAPDVLLVASADHVYRCDFRDVIDAHLASDAEATVVTTRVTEDPSRYAVVTTEAGRVTRLDYKPERPASDVVAAEIFAYRPAVVLEVLEQLAASGPLGDYGERLLPALIDRGGVREHRHEGYWRDVGTIDAYHQAHMELLAAPPPFRLDDPDWPVLSATMPRRPAWLAATAAVHSSLLAAGSAVAGQVEGSVLGPGVTVTEGASVRDSVLLADVTVGPGARVERAIVDEGAQLGEGEIVGSATGEVTVWSGRGPGCG